MSRNDETQELEVVGGVDEEKKKAHGSSLRDRMARRRDELANRTTEKFRVPRYEEFIAVELKAIPWEQTEKILERSQRNPTGAMRNAAAEEIVSATVGFYEITEDETLDLITDVSKWSEVAERFLDQEMPDAPYLVRERIALTALCESQGVMSLNGLWRRWLGGANVGLTTELKSDFS